MHCPHLGGAFLFSSSAQNRNTWGVAPQDKMEEQPGRKGVQFAAPSSSRPSGSRDPASLLHLPSSVLTSVFPAAREEIVSRLTAPGPLIRRVFRAAIARQPSRRPTSGRRTRPEIPCRAGRARAPRPLMIAFGLMCVLCHDDAGQRCELELGNEL